MTQSNAKSRIPSAVRGYALALLTVGVALGISLLLARYNFQGVEFPLFLIAIAVTVWYGGKGPAICAVALSTAAFDYYFTEPRYSFFVTRADVPYYIVFVVFALLITWFSVVRRRVERELLLAHDRLQQELIERTQQASLLNLTHDTIFVRDMSDVITYWNRGAQELYGWAPEQAIGKRSHDLLRTIFPAPIDDINGELLRTGRWEGELKHVKADGSQVVVSSRRPSGIACPIDLCINNAIQ